MSVRESSAGRRLAAWLAGLGVAALLAAWLGIGAGGQAPARQQPIAFNHQAHVTLTDCVFCHRLYRTREVAGRPELFRCMLCHAYPVTDKPGAQALRALAKKGRPISWVRVTRLPAHVRFSHQRHVLVGRVPCRTCHGAIAQTTAPPEAPLVAITMQFCIGCHRAESVQVPADALAALKEAQVGGTLLEALLGLGRRRFPSGEELMAAASRQAGREPDAAVRRRILRELQAAPPITRDCAACHR